MTRTNKSDIIIVSRGQALTERRIKMEVMQDMGMTDSQYKSMRRRDKKELERILEVKTVEEKDKLIKEMLEIIQQDLED